MGKKPKYKYLCPRKIVYHSPRYGQTVTVPKNYLSDGATGATDIWSASWWVHDVLCDTGQWDDGTNCTNWQASRVCSDILKSEGRWVRAYPWLICTFLFGGGQARKNGMVRLKRAPANLPSKPTTDIKKTEP